MPSAITCPPAMNLLSGSDALSIAIEAYFEMKPDASEEVPLPYEGHCFRAFCNGKPIWFCGKCDLAYCPSCHKSGQHQCSFCGWDLCLMPSTVSERESAQRGDFTSPLAAILMARAARAGAAMNSSSSLSSRNTQHLQLTELDGHHTLLPDPEQHSRISEQDVDDIWEC